MYKAFNLKGFDKSFIIPRYRARLIERGRKVTSAGKGSVQRTLTKIAGSKASLDGKKLQDGWFPQVHADVFLSHSRRNENDILMLAGWLDDRFGLKAFVDSAIWGYAGDLLKMIDHEYCYQADSNTYHYQRRNESTSHVHMMLMTALQMMIHKTECLIFVNTPESIAVQQVVTAQTYSPWIFAELTTAGIIRLRTPGRLAKERSRLSAKSIFKEARKDRRLSILHTIGDLQRLSEIDCSDLVTWSEECEAEGESALDKLYELAAS